MKSVHLTMSTRNREDREDLQRASDHETGLWRYIDRRFRNRISKTRSRSPSRPIHREEDDARPAQSPPQLASQVRDDIFDEHGPSFGSIFGSARLALDLPPAISFNYSLPFDGNTINPSSLAHQDAGPSWVSPSQLPIPSPGPPKEPTLSNDPHVPFPQIGAFATWEQVGFFLSLHMRHQHVLTPLVHQPSFVRDLLHRRDIDDEPFRGLLLSIGKSDDLLLI